ncbi:hypothetical protein B0H67DRAFT_259991 [Lasiosphaeris hirsuta]|uniref:Uncharacterized protein n=1 Tax=Lasiosphaeris hirsuta TaxID=260670 RepID=A0AA40AI26_9PEZI|nr:hypothetical protein B0H67DRAFT_259991 [Lasiosphaeris hirsuta]
MEMEGAPQPDRCPKHPPTGTPSPKQPVAPTSTSRYQRHCAETSQSILDRYWAQRLAASWAFRLTTISGCHTEVRRPPAAEPEASQTRAVYPTAVTGLLWRLLSFQHSDVTSQGTQHKAREGRHRGSMSGVLDNSGFLIALLCGETPGDGTTLDEQHMQWILGCVGDGMDGPPHLPWIHAQIEPHAHAQSALVLLKAAGSKRRRDDAPAEHVYPQHHEHPTLCSASSNDAPTKGYSRQHVPRPET